MFLLGKARPETENPMKKKNQHIDSTNPKNNVSLEIIDLDSQNDSSPEDTGSSDDTKEEKSAPKNGIVKFFSRINIHIVLLVVFLLCVIGVVYRLNNWGEFVDLNEIFKDGMGEHDDTMDTILPAIGADGEPIFKHYGEGSNILLFGNAPFADDRDSEDGLANMIQDMTGANVYNCSISSSYLAALNPYLNVDECPMDIFNFYWMATFLVGDYMDDFYVWGLENLGDAAPPEAEEVFAMINTIDLNEIDVIVLMYDASDYLAGHGMYSDFNNTEIIQFTGNMEAGIELIRDNYPHIRFIVLSPTYAYGLDEEGNYVSSDIQLYGQHYLSTYVIKQSDSCAMQSVTFIDNLYGTITEDNAHKYLSDHLHLNPEGRRLVANRFVEALNYYEERVK